MTGEQGILDEKDGSPKGDLPFLVTAAHELKEPLALIRQLSLALQSDAIDSRERERILHQVTLTSERALRLTTDLTRSSRLNQLSFELEPINPQQICEEVAHELTPLYAAKGREIRVSSRYRPILAVANRELLRRIILNFGDNALHYATVATPVELHAGARSKGSTIRIGVRDYGPALSATTWMQLQTQLGALLQPLHTRPQSSGLGLYIARQFADAMCGDIGVTRHRDGTTFYVEMSASTQLRLL